MTDTTKKDTTDKMTLTRSTTKLQLSKPVGSRPKGSGGVTVEVKKVRTVVRKGEESAAAPAPRRVTSASAEDLAALSQPRKSDAYQDSSLGKAGKVSRNLTTDEHEVRLRALQTAAASDEEERRQAEELAQMSDERRKAREELRTIEEIQREEERNLERERQAKLAAVVEEETVKPATEVKGKRWKKGADDIDEDEEKVGGRKKKRALRSQLDEDDDEFKLTNLDTKEIFHEVEEKISFDGLAAGIGGEVEDYSEDVEGNDASVLSVSKKVTAAGLVNAVKGNERAILAVPDIEKVKKSLRSEARVERSVDKRTATKRVQEMLERKLAEASKNQPRTVARSNKRNKKQRVSEHVAREVIIPDSITVAQLANRMAVRAVDVVKELMKMGIMGQAEHVLDADTAELIVGELGHKAKRVSDADIEREVFDGVENDGDDEATLVSRPPVVTVMGHVDHGKTSLLDALRSTDVVSGEAGGITQHIGAYQVTMESGDKITFLDTPGHEAFTAMRARGAQVTDIVVLVVAADDGIMEQTQEAINHAKAANVPIIVAINKIDKQGADPQRVKTELMNYELVAEEFGGDVMCVEVSALQRLNLDKLEEAILLQSEVLELKANPNREAVGFVVEARMDKGRGVVASMLVSKGTLRKGDIIVAGTSLGRVRMMTDDKGRVLEDAGPTIPVEVLGLDEVPPAGEPFVVVDSEKTAREVIDYRKDLALKEKTGGRLSLDSLFSGAQAIQELPLIVKSDVHGSAEAIVTSLQKIEHDEVRVNVIHSGVGGINESDVGLAVTSNAVILAFNVRAEAKAKQLAAEEKVDIRYYSIIYNLIDDVKAALSGLLSPARREEFLGYAEIKEVFTLSSKAGKVAGCTVTSGHMKRGAKVRLLRDNVVIHEGDLKTLRRFKDDVKEVREGYECGMAFERYNDIKIGDVIEAFEIVEEVRTI